MPSVTARAEEELTRKHPHPQKTHALKVRYHLEPRHRDALINLVTSEHSNATWINPYVDSRKIMIIK